MNLTRLIWRCLAAASAVVIGLAGVTAASKASADSPTATLDPTSTAVGTQAPVKPVYPKLSLGDPVTGGDWTPQMCRNGDDGQPLPIPAIAMLHRLSFDLSKASRVTLSIGPALGSVHPVERALASVGRPYLVEPFGFEVEELSDIDGHKPATAIYDPNPQPGWYPDYPQPLSPSVTLDLDAGTYLTDTNYGYCDGFFTISLDSIVPLPQANSSVPAKVKAVKLAKKSLKLKVGQKVKLRISIVPKKALVTKLIWKSNHPKTVKVSKTGRVKALTPGKATITVKAKTGKAAKIRITVR